MRFSIKKILRFGMAMLYSTIAYQYCATFDSSSSEGATGYFLLSIENGTSSHSFFLALNEFSTTCDLNQGLAYHIHTNWLNTTTMSSSNAYCAKALTGNHYDPNLACGPNSEDSNDLCADLGRTSSSGYHYSCSASNYSMGKYSYCEVGDLSGKFGRVYMTEIGSDTFQVNGITDYQPPYVANYMMSDYVAHQWASIVFHCGEDGSRLVCGVLQQQEDGDLCGSTEQKHHNSDDDEWSPDGWNSLAKLLVGLSAVMVVGVLGTVYAFRKRPLEDTGERREVFNVM